MGYFLNCGSAYGFQNSRTQNFQQSDKVKEFDLAGLLHDPSRMMEEPVEVCLKASGKVDGLRFPGLSKRCDCRVILFPNLREHFPLEAERTKESLNNMTFSD